jgi:hypothetical protein
MKLSVPCSRSINTKKCRSDGNRMWDLWVCSQELWLLSHYLRQVVNKWQKKWNIKQKKQQTPWPLICKRTIKKKMAHTNAKVCTVN